MCTYTAVVNTSCTLSDLARDTRQRAVTANRRNRSTSTLPRRLQGAAPVQLAGERRRQAGGNARALQRAGGAALACVDDVMPLRPRRVQRQAASTQGHLFAAHRGVGATESVQQIAELRLRLKSHAVCMYIKYNTM